MSLSPVYHKSARTEGATLAYKHFQARSNLGDHHGVNLLAIINSIQNSERNVY